MSDTLRIGTFNVENLFGRAKVFNYYDHARGDELLWRIDEFRVLIEKPTYSASDKQEILRLYREELKDFISVREDRGKLFRRRGYAVTGVKADGAGDWDGAIELKLARFDDVARKNTAKIIKKIKADVLCIVEAESRPVLEAFDAHLLDYMYKYEMLIDANDRRGIDVGLYSKHAAGGVWTHMFDKSGTKTIFSRDCLEVEVTLPGGRPLYVLCNHFKSRGYDFDGTANQRRRRQATRVAEILGEYDLRHDWVVVAGDLNDNPTSAPLQPLLTVADLYDVLELQFPNNRAKRWTYHYDSFEQIDYLLVSRALRDAFSRAGVERRGIAGLRRLTTAANGQVDVETEFDSVTHWTNAASDHAAMWAEFNL